MLTKQDLVNSVNQYHAQKGYFRKAASLFSNEVRGAMSAGMAVLNAFIQELPRGELSRENITALRRILMDHEGEDLTKRIFNQISRQLPRPIVEPVVPPQSTPTLSSFVPRLNSGITAADFGCARTHLTAKKVLFGFPEVPISNYRCQIYTGVKITENGIDYDDSDLCIEPTALPPAAVIVIDDQQKEDRRVKNFYYGKETFHAVANKWTAITDADFYDQLTAIRATVPIQVGHSDLAGHYYFRHQNPAVSFVRIEYNLRRSSNYRVDLKRDPNEKELDMMANIGRMQLGELLNHPEIVADFLPGESERAKIFALVFFFRSFSPQALPEECANDNILQKLVHSFELQQGVCLERVILFMILAKRLNLIAQFPVNRLHTFMQAQYGSRCWGFDLGGGDVDVTIFEERQRAMARHDSFLVPLPQLLPLPDQLVEFSRRYDVGRGGLASIFAELQRATIAERQVIPQEISMPSRANITKFI